MRSTYMSKVRLRNIDKQSQTELPNGVPIVDGWSDDSHESIRVIYEFEENEVNGGDADDKQKRRRNGESDRKHCSDSEELLIK